MYLHKSKNFFHNYPKIIATNEQLFENTCEGIKYIRDSLSSNFRKS